MRSILQQMVYTIVQLALPAVVFFCEQGKRSIIYVGCGEALRHQPLQGYSDQSAMADHKHLAVMVYCADIFQKKCSSLSHSFTCFQPKLQLMPMFAPLLPPLTFRHALDQPAVHLADSVICKPFCYAQGAGL